MRNNKILALLLIMLLNCFCSSSAFAVIQVNPQWAKSVTTGSGNSSFLEIIRDSSGNTYAAGYITGTGTYDFGNNIQVNGTSSTTNVILVKYDKNGKAL